MAIIKKQQACTPESSAPPAAAETAASSTAQDVLNVICVDVIDHGMREMPWGVKPQVSFVFENEVDGQPRWYTRTYNNYRYSKSALTLDISNWLGRDISGDDSTWELGEAVGEQARLITSDAISQAGNHYVKIESVNPSGIEEVQASGTYERRNYE